MKKYFIIFFVLILLFSIFINFYGLENPYIFNDEGTLIISAIKFYKANFSVGIQYAVEHPPIAKFIMGIPSNFIVTAYEDTNAIKNEIYGWNYLAWLPIKDLYIPIRMMSAIFGIFSLLFIFLIGKELYNNEVGLFSMLIATFSFDLLTYSRLILMEIYMVAFCLVTLYFFIRLIKNEKIINFIGFFIFLVLSLGSRTGQPLILLFIMAISYPLLTKKLQKKNILAFYAILFIAYIAIFWLIYNPNANVWGYFGFSTPLSLIELNAIPLFSLFLRNSYLFLFGLISSIFLFIAKRKEVVSRIRNKTPDTVLLLFALISLLAFSFLRYGENVRYLIFMFIPFYIIGGYATYYFFKKYNVVKLIVIGLVIVTLYQMMIYYPLFLNYYNFAFTGNNDMIANKVLNEIKDENLIVTNYLPVLVYNAKSIPMPVPIANCGEIMAATNLTNCNEKDIKNLALKKPMIVYYGPNIKNDSIICDVFKTINMTEIENFQDVHIFKVD